MFYLFPTSCLEIAKHALVDQSSCMFDRQWETDTRSQMARICVCSFDLWSVLVRLGLFVDWLEVVDGQATQAPELVQISWHPHATVAAHAFPHRLAIFVGLGLLSRHDAAWYWVWCLVEHGDQVILKGHIGVVEIEVLVALFAPKDLGQWVARGAAVGMLSCGRGTWPRGRWQYALGIKRRRVEIVLGRSREVLVALGDGIGGAAGGGGVVAARAAAGQQA